MQGQRYRPYGVGVFPLNYTARERTVLSLQAKRDRRHIPPLWFWRLLTPDEELSGASVSSEEYFEQPLVLRRYATPVAAHIFVDDSGETKGMKRGKVDTEGVIKIEMSRAEAIRLFGVFQVLSDQYEVPTNPNEQVYIPQPGDLFFFKGTHLRVHQLVDVDHFGPTGIPGKWEGTASQFVDDASAPILASRADLIPPSDQPPQPVGHGEIKWPG